MRLLSSLFSLFLISCLVPLTPVTAQDEPGPDAAPPATPAAAAPAATPPALGTELQKGSYAFGMQVGRNLGMIGKQLDLEVFSRGIRDTVEGNPAMNNEEARAAFEAFRDLAIEQANAANINEGKRYLKDNLEKDKEVVQLPSGLQYKIVKKGEGARPAKTDTVEVHYTGTLIDGTKFDSSRDRGKPTSFPVNGVIKGWMEGLQLMPVGSSYMFYIPSDLAYGAGGQGPIPPHSVLVFDVELLGIK